MKKLTQSIKDLSTMLAGFGNEIKEEEFERVANRIVETTESVLGKPVPTDIGAQLAIFKRRFGTEGISIAAEFEKEFLKPEERKNVSDLGRSLNWSNLDPFSVCIKQIRNSNNNNYSVNIPYMNISDGEFVNKSGKRGNSMENFLPNVVPATKEEVLDFIRGVVGVGKYYVTALGFSAESFRLTESNVLDLRSVMKECADYVKKITEAAESVAFPKKKVIKETEVDDVVARVSSALDKIAGSIDQKTYLAMCKVFSSLLNDADLASAPPQPTLTRHKDAMTVHWRVGSMVIPLDNGNSHNYLMGSPILYKGDCTFLNFNGLYGNNMDARPEASRFATPEEIDDYFTCLGDLLSCVPDNASEILARLAFIIEAASVPRLPVESSTAPEELA